MKIRGFIITGVILLAAGAGITGYAATREDFNKDMFTGGVTFSEISYNGEDSGKVENVKFNASADYINIVKSDTNEIKMNVKESAFYSYTYQINEETNTLEINQVKKEEWPFLIAFSFWNEEPFVLELPNTVALEVELNAGALKINDLDLNDVKLHMNAGATKLDNVVAKNVNLDIDAGAASFENVTFDDLTVKLNAGALEFKNASVNSFVADIDAGSFEYKGVVKTSATLEVSAGSGDIVLTDGADNYTVNGIGNGAAQIHYTCSAGSVKVSYAE